MKIVEFKNGKYGVRKWTLMGYLFAVNKSGNWHPKSALLTQEFDEIEYADEVLASMRDVDSRNNDMGE